MRFLNLYPLATVLLFLSSITQAQIVKQYIEPRTGQISLTESIAIPAEDAGYTLVLPLQETPKGLIVFFNADRDTSGKIFHYSIPKGIAVAYVTTGNRLDFFFEKEEMQLVESYLAAIIDDHKIPKANLMFAGMSLAGTRALKLSLFACTPDSKHRLKPKAVAMCDSPLDFVRFWRECNKARILKFHAVASNEGEWVAGYLERNLKGTPQTNLNAYLDYSPFSHTLIDTSKLKCLSDVLIRAYTEPDVLWWMNTRRKDYYGINAIDMAALVNELHIHGNLNAELVVTKDKGVLPDGSKHPHSWSIVDERELVDWFDSAIASE